MKGPVINLLRWLLFLAGLWLAGRLLVRQLKDIAWASLQVDWRWLAVALGVNLAYVWLYAALWAQLAAANGLKLPARTAYGIYFHALALKYLPFRVAGMGYRLMAYQRNGGWPLPRIAGVLYFETMLVLAAGGVVLALASPWVRWQTLGLSVSNWIASGVALAGLLLLPAGLARIGRSHWARFSARNIREFSGASGYLRYLWRYTLAWGLLGTGLLCTLQALGVACSAGLWITALWAYAAAGLAGMLALFAPAGLGVRDGILALALGTVLPPATAAVGALAARGLAVLSEMAWAILGNWLLQKPSPIPGFSYE